MIPRAKLDEWEVLALKRGAPDPNGDVHALELVAALREAMELLSAVRDGGALLGHPMFQPEATRIAALLAAFEGGSP